jgi:hypothetical protein
MRFSYFSTRWFVVAAGLAGVFAACSDDADTATSGGATSGTTGTGGVDFTTVASSGTGGTGGTGGSTPACESGSTTGPFLLASRFGGAGDQAGAAVTTDAAGNVLITGVFAGTVNFGGGDLTSTDADVDLYVAKFSATGQHLWSQRFGEVKAQVGTAIATDAAGNVYVTGLFLGSMTVGGTVLTTSGSGLFSDAFLVKLDPTGVAQWAKSFVGGTNDGETSRAVAVSAGKVAIVGDYQGTINLGGGPLVAVGGIDTFVAEFSDNGDPLWSKSFGDVGDQFGRSVAYDPQGNVLVTGDAQGAVDFGGGPKMAQGDPSVFVAKLGAAGEHVYSFSFGDGASSGVGITATSDGGAVITGDFQGNIDFGGGPLESPANDDVFVARLDAQGGHVWSRRFGDELAQHARGVAVDGSGNVLVTGYYSGTMTFGEMVLTNAGIFDAYAAKLDSEGCSVWAKSFGDPAYQSGDGVAVDGSGNAFFTGKFAGAVDFGGGDLVSAGGADIFLTKLGP